MEDQQPVSLNEITSYALAFSDQFRVVARRLERAPLSNEERAAINEVFNDCNDRLDEVLAILAKAEAWE